MQEMMKEGLTQWVPLAPLLAALGIMLSLALMVERFLQIFAWVIERLNLVREFATEPPARQFDETVALYQKAKAEDELLRQPPDPSAEREPEIPRRNEEPMQTPPLPFTPAQPIKLTKEFWLQISGLLVAVAVCIYSRFSIWGLVEWLKHWAAGQPPTETPATLAGMIFTGIIIGAGSKPVHFLMNFLIKRKVIVTRESLKKATPVTPPPSAAMPPAPPSTPSPVESPPSSPPLTIEKLVGVRYDGGYQPQRLEYTHQRTRPIDLIVYHHTAMHPDAPLEAIIAQFEQRGWLTGYHAVVFPDGRIQVICRWDRIGNHAKGYNDRSLGLALHGNFETRPTVPQNNARGQYGPSIPTSDQLDAAARLIALWMHLYDMPQAFKNVLVPHSDLNSTACPGNRFPHAALQELAKTYYQRWEADQTFQAALQAFKRMPMV